MTVPAGGRWHSGPTRCVRVSADGRFVAQLIDVDAPTDRQHADRLRGRPPAGGCSGRSAHRSSPATSPSTPTGRWSPSPADPPGTSPSTASPTANSSARLPGSASPEGVDLARDTAAVDFGADGRIYLGSMLGPDPGRSTRRPCRSSPPTTRHCCRHTTRSSSPTPACSSPPATRRPSPSTPSTGATRWTIAASAGQQRLQLDRRRRSPRRGSTAAARSAPADDRTSAGSAASRSGTWRPGYRPASCSTPNRAPSETSPSPPTNGSWSPSATTPRSSPAGGSTGPGR